MSRRSTANRDPPANRRCPCVRASNAPPAQGPHVTLPAKRTQETDTRIVSSLRCAEVLPLGIMLRMPAQRCTCRTAQSGRAATNQHDQPNSHALLFASKHLPFSLCINRAALHPHLGVLPRPANGRARMPACRTRNLAPTCKINQSLLQTQASGAARRRHLRPVARRHPPPAWPAPPLSIHLP